MDLHGIPPYHVGRRHQPDFDRRASEGPRPNRVLPEVQDGLKLDLISLRVLQQWQHHFDSESFRNVEEHDLAAVEILSLNPLDMQTKVKLDLIVHIKDVIQLPTKFILSERPNKLCESFRPVIHSTLLKRCTVMVVAPRIHLFTGSGTT